MRKKNYYQNTHFISSLPTISHLPKDQGIEVAFVGHSNSGKSSSLNTLTNKKSLARVSKTPGSTQFINLFKVYEGFYIVDWPGYGFAKVPIKIKRKWMFFLKEYFKNRSSLKGVIVVMDIRHPMKMLDREIILLAIKNMIPVQILLNKSDKLKTSESKFTLFQVKKTIETFSNYVKVDLFSSKGIGVNVLRDTLDFWFTSNL
ncbi:GTP-binding protein EngB [Candidatus Photodesmus katoptron]|uniref:Probable GTP-binding protein EngB n=1 Tax=Candidatus Photodesmus katoptron Akat1 TaxID=1236703 RepID=S3DHT8_9GAMM|nr:ribosome biogenesis GTP-binding protein YihA/YsxC [Candidatus Photodesmus katoptron]EPE38022.1 GTPase [Candidatus Photodesmus katoptron Akat1]KEY90759.1 GTP-binding protein EngB [Candidatus Photodesmus katoptron]